MLIELALWSGCAAVWKRALRRSSAPPRRVMAPPPPAAPKVKPKPAPRFSVARLAKDLKGTLQADGRQALQLDLDPEERAAMAKYRRESTKNLVLSAGATGLALLGNRSRLFSVLGAAGVLWLSRDLFALVAKDFRRGHYLSIYLIGVVMLVGMIATGRLALAAFSGVVGGLFGKIVNRVEDDSEQALVRVFSGHPAQVWVLVDGVELAVDFHAIKPGDLVIVNAGEVVPVDGCIQTGAGQVDQHLLTGESQPVDKVPGEAVFASTLLLSGRLAIRVETAGEDTMAAKIGQVLARTQGYKETLILRGRRISDRYLPVTVGLSAVTWPLLGPQAAIAVLWSSLGGTMSAFGPLSVLSYLQILSRHGILVKDGRIFETLRQVDTVVFDKTGTLTLEEPTVGRIHAGEGFTEHAVLRAAATAEYRQPHPIARAILAAATARGLELPDLAQASYEVGYGIAVQVAGEALIRVGSRRFLEGAGLVIPATLESLAQQAEAAGHSLVYVGLGERLAGAIELAPTPRPEAAAVVAFLKARGIRLYIISGDHPGPTARLAASLGIDDYFAETLPAHKAERVQGLRAAGRCVCFIGDGINDAIALQAAQVSISLKGASSAATDTAQIVFMDGTLTQLPQLLRLADEYEATMQTNLVASFAPGVIIIGGVYLFNLGIGAAMTLCYLGGVAGLGNTLWPLIKHQDAGGRTVQSGAAPLTPD
jgi:heavy metal translocating P-type ATPase